ncbi:hypothetical protein [Actinocatenispora sera]|uniref:Lipoprotein n=1 Tax=Actinocatenispora sera TaxID=390989 RepID=A0A810L3K5_9ACTN|nr:hypothetical protein [Actinocatenispora sera]BCJ30140.1 hypothetical protein Asera_42480 [Actinocatenispora sera]
MGRIVRAPERRNAVPVGAATVLLTAALTGCTGPAAGNDPAPAKVGPPVRSVTVLDDPDPATLSAAVSRHLFASAPAVIVAAASDPQGLHRAADLAEQRRVPMLVAGGAAGTGRAGGAPTGAPSATTSPAGTASDGGTAALGAELRRLHPQNVLTVDAAAQRAVRAALGSASDTTSVRTDPAEVPTTRPARGLPGVTVLVHAGGDAATRAGATAATATATAAGATVVPVHGDDPRADRTAIAALAHRDPAAVLAAGTGFGPADRLGARLAVAVAGRQLPGGGQVMFPGRRLVALYGHPGTAVLGALGAQDLPGSIARAKQVAKPYRTGGVPVVPTFEIIATTAQASPGPDGRYSAASSVASLRPWVRAAGAAGMYVVLDLQPGRADLLDQAKRYRSLLALPYVGLALDPEWKLAAGQKPLEQIGTVDASEINRVSDWLSALTAAHRLPQKLLVLHQFQLSMIGHEDRLDLGHDNLSLLIHMDGQGSPSLKDETWSGVVGARPDGVALGWKNFYTKDHPMLTPAQTLAQRPRPDMISYQ